jgi:hypothetical protein
VADELERARAALEAGNTDEALVLLWNAVEPARLAGDEQRLREIATLAGAIPGREASDLVEATGVPPTARESRGESAGPKTRPRVGRLIGAAVWLFIVAAVVVSSVLRGEDAEITRSPSPTVHSIVPIVVEAPGLYLVPLADYPAEDLNALVLDLVPHAGAVDVVPALGLGPTTYDPVRSQFIAEALLQRLTEDWRVTPGVHALLVGVTSLDMYRRERPAIPSVRLVRSSDGRYVVISTHGLSSDGEIRRDQLLQILKREVRRADVFATSD